MYGCTKAGVSELTASLAVGKKGSRQDCGIPVPRLSRNSCAMPQVEAQLANFHCNLTANVHLTHHFYGQMISKGLKGCIVYTGSSCYCLLYVCTFVNFNIVIAELFRMIEEPFRKRGSRQDCGIRVLRKQCVCVLGT